MKVRQSIVSFGSSPFLFDINLNINVALAPAMHFGGVGPPRAVELVALHGH